MSSRSEICSKITDQDEAAADSTDGPPPMRDYKPAKMNPNSTDLFWQSHQAEYEAREASTRDSIGRVRRHNAAYPQLRDELDRRRSLTKITPAKAIMANGRAACTCDKCLKIKKGLKESRKKSRRIGSRHDDKIVKCREFCSRCGMCRKVKNNLKNSVFDKEDFPTDSRHSKNFKNRSSSYDKRANSTRDLRTDKINNALKVASKPGTLKITRQFYKTSMKNDSSSRKRPRIENADIGNDSGDADSSASSKKFRSIDGSRAHSIATEPSVPSYNSSFSLGLENEPMVSRSQNT